MAFRFKQFSVNDTNSTLKVGTDAVLLGVWAGSGKPENILDAGTGCGVLSLMLAQRFQNSRIKAIDIHEGSVLDALENFRASPWRDRLSVQLQSVQQFANEDHAKFDLIISNPPFFNSSLLPPDAKKKIAKHSGELSYSDLAEASRLLLTPEGKLALILPYENREVFSEIAQNSGLYCIREMIICPVEGKKPNRYMSEWGFSMQACKTEELNIRGRDHHYTEEYKLLTRGFYLAH